LAREAAHADASGGEIAPEDEKEQAGTGAVFSHAVVRKDKNGRRRAGHVEVFVRPLP
jgi:hypothetical protein